MTRKFMRWLSLPVLLLVLTTLSPAAAAEERIYTIKKGDTLWDLSQRFIQDPYYWPNIWAKNPDISNPHLIFPGQKIRILDGRLEILPAYPGGQPEPPEELSAAAAEIPASATREDEITVRSTGAGHGFILTDEEPLGLLVDSVDNRVLLTEDDIVFVKMKDPGSVAIGDVYSLFQRGRLVEHPQSGEPIGTMMNNLGDLKVTGINNGTVVARIDTAFREITRGAELFSYVSPHQDIVLQDAAAELSGYVIAARDERGTLSTGDVIFIDLGTDAGLVSGNLFYLTRPRTVSDELLEQAGDLELPDAVLGAAVAVDTKANHASAVIIKSVAAAHIGDQVALGSE